MSYDSRPDTLAHIEEVRKLLYAAVKEMLWRAYFHDMSKLESPEVEAFNEYGPKLRESAYGSDEYRRNLEGMREALWHHYEANSHHPEHYTDGVHGMDLFDLVEMLCDWKAATMRHDDGSLDSSITINRGRFGYGDEIEGLLRRTAERMGLLSEG